MLQLAHTVFFELKDLSTGEGNGTPLQYSCLENPVDGGAWWAAVHGVARSRTRLCDFTSLSIWDVKMKVLDAQSCLTFCDPMDYIAHQAPLDFPSNTVVGCYSCLQVFFPTQGSIPGPLHYRQILYRLNYQGSSLKHSRQTEAAEQAYEEAEAALPSWHVEKEADV